MYDIRQNPSRTAAVSCHDVVYWPLPPLAPPFQTSKLQAGPFEDQPALRHATPHWCACLLLDLHPLFSSVHGWHLCVNMCGAHHALLTPSLHTYGHHECTSMQQLTKHVHTDISTVDAECCPLTLSAASAAPCCNSFADCVLEQESLTPGREKTKKNRWARAWGHAPLAGAPSSAALEAVFI